MLFDREFHDTLARAARNTVLADILRSLHERSLRFWFISLRDPDHHRSVFAQHRAIVAALKSRQPDAAENAMREHILAFQRNVTRQVEGGRAPNKETQPMKNPKLHDEFKKIDMTTGWVTPAGYPGVSSRRSWPARLMKPAEQAIGPGF